MNEQRVAAVTGASAGVGKETARQLLQAGWRVIGVGRNPDRCAQAEADLASEGDFTMLQADLALMADVARLAGEISGMTDRLDALVNNAGGVTADLRITSEGNEQTFAANHLGAFLLTQKLMPLLEATAAKAGAGNVRVIGVSSTGHEQCPGIRWDDLNHSHNYLSGAAYCQAKLANILFTRELARRVAGKGIAAHVMHPGVVDSNFASHCEPGMKAYMDSIMDQANLPDVPARTVTYLASAEEPGQVNGLYWHDMQAIEPSDAAQDDNAAHRLWEVSERLVAGY